MYPNQNLDSSDNAETYPSNSYYSDQPYQQPTQPAPQKSNHTFTLVLIIILAIFAIGGVAFGTFTFINSSQEITKLNETISAQDSAIKDSTALTTTDNNNTSDYIYIGAWGIKIKIPEELSWVGYTFNPSNDTSSISVYGAKGQFDTRPNFLNSIESISGYGFITRAPLGYGSVDGIKVFSNNGYDYFYTMLQQANIENTEDAALEASSRDLIRAMLTTADNYSLIQ